jgi:hypothetical protein
MTTLITGASPVTCSINWMDGDSPNYQLCKIELIFPLSNPSEANEELTLVILRGMIEALTQSSTFGTYYISD